MPLPFKITPDMATDDPGIRQKILDRTLDLRKKSAWDRHCAWADKENDKIQTRNFWAVLVFLVCFVLVMVAAVVKLFWG